MLKINLKELKMVFANKIDGVSWISDRIDNLWLLKEPINGYNAIYCLEQSADDLWHDMQFFLVEYDRQEETFLAPSLRTGCLFYQIDLNHETTDPSVVEVKFDENGNVIRKSFWS